MEVLSTGLHDHIFTANSRIEITVFSPSGAISSLPSWSFTLTFSPLSQTLHWILVSQFRMDFQVAPDHSRPWLQITIEKKNENKTNLLRPRCSTHLRKAHIS